MFRDIAAFIIICFTISIVWQPRKTGEMFKEIKKEFDLGLYGLLLKEIKPEVPDSIQVQEFLKQKK